MIARAGFVSRMSAFVIDAFLVMLAMRGTAWLLGGTAKALGHFAPPVNLARLVIAALPLLVAVYNVGFWTAFGQTPGKFVMGIKIVREGGQRLGLGLAILRLLGYLLSALPFYLGFLWILGRDRRAWHDRLAHTEVVYVVPRRSASAAGALSLRRLHPPPALVLALALLGCLLAASCAAQMGHNAARGATQGLRNQAADAGYAGAPPLTVASANVVKGALYQLDQPKEMERLRALTAQLATQAVQSAIESATQAVTGAGGGTSAGDSPIEEASAQAMDTIQDQLVSALGARGTGPLGRSLAATTGELTATAARSAAGNLFPGCDPRQSPGCVERQIFELSRATGVGVIRGIKQELRWPVLIGIFVAGFVSALFVTLLWQLMGTRRLLRHGQARALDPLRTTATQE